MSSSVNLDPKLRFIILYQDAEMKISRISKILGVAESTLYNWKDKVDSNVNILEHQTKNFHPKITKEKRKSIIKDAKTSPYSVSSRELGARHDVSHTTVCNLLNEMGSNFKKVKKNHVLTAEEKEDRVNYCKDMLKYNGSKIKNAFFSDEMGIRLSKILSLKNKIWNIPGKKVKTERITTDVKLNCWGAISWNGATSLQIYTQNLNNKLYQKIIGEHAMEIEDTYRGRTCYLQQDNHPTHRDMTILDEYSTIELLDFPTYSADLNPIENLWSTLKYRVARDAPRNEDDLVESLINNWNELTEVENLRPYIETLFDRYEECIKKDGASLPY